MESEICGIGFEICDGNKKCFGYNMEKPPEDDCCPICFGDFKVPCKADCGHWYCGSCVLQLWKYRSRPRRCKCPFCSSEITKLTPDASLAGTTEFEVVEVLESIDHYNRFYVEGIQGFFLILAFYLWKHGPFLHLYIWRMLKDLVQFVLYTSPAFLKRAFVDLIKHPERIRLNFLRLHLIACTFLLHILRVFLPSGCLRVQVSKLILYIDYTFIVLFILPFVLLMCKTWIHIVWLRFRIWRVGREVDALRAQNAALQERELALQAVNAILQEQQALRGSDW